MRRGDVPRRDPWYRRLPPGTITKLAIGLAVVVMFGWPIAHAVRLALIRSHRIPPPIHRVKPGMSEHEVNTVLQCKPTHSGVTRGEGRLIPHDQPVPGGRVYRTWHSEHM